MTQGDTGGMIVRPLTFVVGTGRSGSTALSHILHQHPDILSLNELLASVDSKEYDALPAEPVDGRRFWQILADPNPLFDRMARSGAPLPEVSYPRCPGGRFSAHTTGVPALCLMVLPLLSDDPDGLLDELAAEVPGWPPRSGAEHYEALFDLLCARFGRRVVVERSGYSVGWVPRLRAAFPEARYVHLYRSGPDCAVSMSRHTGYRLITLLREAMARVGVATPVELTPERVASLPPELAGLFEDPFEASLVLGRDLPVTRFGALWSEIILEGVAHLEPVPEAMRTSLAYEDLLDAPDKELTRLAEFAGVEPYQRWLETGRAMLDGSRRGASLRLPAGELAALRESCEPGILALR